MNSANLSKGPPLSLGSCGGDLPFRFPTRSPFLPAALPGRLAGAWCLADQLLVGERRPRCRQRPRNRTPSLPCGC